MFLKQQSSYVLRNVLTLDLCAEDDIRNLLSAFLLHKTKHIAIKEKMP